MSAFIKAMFIKAMRFVGDLDDEFYDDERQRDVWNESSAIGFQLFYWSILIAAAVLPWASGQTGAWIGLGLLVAATVVGCATMGYSAARGVNLYTAARMGRVRGIVVGLLVAVGAISVLVTLQPEVYSEPSTWVGGAVGGIVGGGAVGAAIWYMRRRNARFENEEV
ncbi:DUF2029 domain-containing protein [Rhodococcus sovatensis]|uniref:DUF2029 domain-containing protein n=1 Tax=Rhodococcus sovatensis TaxID=1805840 RepID=A0ABZ2PDV3_9NOCA